MKVRKDWICLRYDNNGYLIYSGTTKHIVWALFSNSQHMAIALGYRDKLVEGWDNEVTDSRTVNPYIK